MAMSRSTDRLLKLIFDWIQEGEEYSSNLRALARELESLREKCNAAETVGSSVAVVGAVCLIGAGVATVLTGGAALPLLGAVGATCSGVGAGISVVSVITEHFQSSSELDKVKKIDKKCNDIAEEIQELFDKLKAECPSRNSDDKDRHVVSEILRTMVKQNGLADEIPIKDFDDLMNSLKENALFKGITRGLATSLLRKVLDVLTVFSLKMEGKFLSNIVSKGGKQIVKGVVGKGAAKILGGIVGLAFSLPEAIDNWTEAIKKNHVTEASQSLRDTAKQIKEATEKLSNNLSEIKEILKEVVRNQGSTTAGKTTDKKICHKLKNRPRQRFRPLFLPRVRFTPDTSRCSSGSSSSSSSSSSSEEEDEELKMALLNARSVNKNSIREENKLINLILKNKLDVFLITETWLKEGDVGNQALIDVLPPSCSFVHRPRVVGRGGGVAIVFANDVQCKQVDFPLTSEIEYIAAAVSRRSDPEPILVLCIYRPPDGTSARFNFLLELCMFLSDVFRSYRNVIIGGDFNIWMDDKNKKATRGFVDILSEFKLTQHVDQTTHSGGHILDLVLSTPSVSIRYLSVQDDGISDHKTVYFTAKVEDAASAMKKLSI